ncbi:MAG: hypothetical protein QOG02_798 [Gaiellales bacterium]|nr:hypothetical protein [Gaiellales bacterium]MDX6545024.1 hypothetical protein [Gaiellales bacterium]
MNVLEQIRVRAAADSPLWGDALLPGDPPPAEYQGRCPDSHLLGVEMIREGYLLHGGRSRLFAQDDRDLALLTGDYLYAAGLVEICTTGDLGAVTALAGLISACARDRGEGLDDHEERWTAALAAIA